MNSLKKRRKLEDDDGLALTLSLPLPPPRQPSSPWVRSTRTALTSQTDQQELKLHWASSDSRFMCPVDFDYLRPTPDQPRVVGNGGVVPFHRLPRHNPNQVPGNGKSETVPAPFRWASTHRATVYSLDILLTNQIFSISGDVYCNNCDRRFKIEYDLRQKFAEIGTFIAMNKNSMHDRAPNIWKNPIFPGCRFCEKEHSLRPIIAEKKKSINWLFLLLGQMLGCCTLEHSNISASTPRTIEPEPKIEFFISPISNYANNWIQTDLSIGDSGVSPIRKPVVWSAAAFVFPGVRFEILSGDDIWE